MMASYPGAGPKNRVCAASDILYRPAAHRSKFLTAFPGFWRLSKFSVPSEFRETNWNRSFVTKSSTVASGLDESELEADEFPPSLPSSPMALETSAKKSSSDSERSLTASSSIFDWSSPTRHRTFGLFRYFLDSPILFTDNAKAEARFAAASESSIASSFAKIGARVLSTFATTDGFARIGAHSSAAETMGIMPNAVADDAAVTAKTATR